MNPHLDAMNELKKGLTHGMNDSAERCFELLYASTIEKGLPHGNWKKEGKWVLKQVRRIGRTAQKFSGEKEVSWTDLAKSANSLIPVIQEFCADSKQAEDERQSFGDWCVGYVEIPETEPT